MPVLDCGSMDSIKTGFEPIPAQKKVRVKVTAPTDEQKKNEIYKDADGRFSMVKFWLTILEGPFTNRVVQFSTFTSVTKEAYLGWKLKNAGSLLSEPEKAKAWEEKEYLKNLKRFQDAVGVNFATQGTEDAYGKELLIDITQKANDDGEIFNEARNPRKIG